MPAKKIAPLHPGEVLFEEFMKPLGISQNQLARDLGVPPRRINEIVHGRRSVSADTALRLATHFRTTPGFWMNLQAQHDLDMEEDAKASKIAKEVRVHPSVQTLTV